MIIDDSHEGEWFQFFESRLNGRGEVEFLDPKPDAGRICIRSILPFVEERDSARKRKAEFVLNPKSHSMERVSYLEDLSAQEARKEKEDAYDYAITGWENIFDAKGNEIPCTRENKLRLMAIPVFDRFIARCFHLLTESGIRSKEEERKNE